MLTPQEESYILAHAYIPEHVVGLITSLSAGEPFLIDDYFCCRKNDWVIFIGYPLQGQFDQGNLELILEEIKKRFKPHRISLIAPMLSDRLASICRERDSDYYYILETRKPRIRSPVKRNLRKAARKVSVQCADQMKPDHQGLMHEFVQSADPPQRVKHLLYKMPQYVQSAPHAFVLNAWCHNDRLAAFYVIDLTAKKFANFIIGCYSKKNYVLGASDLLLMTLIQKSADCGKRYIHLGLGVNSGIRRFKLKWGARPTQNYEMCELTIRRPLLKQALKAVMDKAMLQR